MYVYFEQKKTGEFGKNHLKGIHLKKPNGSELADALAVAERDGFTVIYVYDSAKTIVQTAEALSQTTGLLIGWSSFCLSLPAFRLDFDAVE